MESRLFATTISWRGATYKLKRRGPRIDPWGTPKSTGRGLDVVFPMMTDCVRPLKQVENQCSTVPETPDVWNQALVGTLC